MSDQVMPDTTGNPAMPAALERAMAGLPATDKPSEYASMTDVELAQRSYSLRYRGNELLPSVIDELIRVRLQLRAALASDGPDQGGA